MAQLRFYAREDQLVPLPGYTPGTGQLALFVGRTFDAKLNGFPAVEDAASFDSESAAGQRLMKLTRRDGALWAADEATARLCSVAFVETEFKDGAHVAKAVAPEPEATPSKGSDS